MFTKKDPDEQADDKRRKCLAVARAQMGGMGSATEKLLTAGIYLEVAAIRDLLEKFTDAPTA